MTYSPHLSQSVSRRSILAGAGAGAAALVTSGLAGAQEGEAAELAQPASGRPFELKYAPHFGMFRHSAGDDLVAQLEFAAGEGFRAWEDNWMARRPVEEQTRISEAMTRLGLEMGVFVADADSRSTKYADGGAENIRICQQIARDAIPVAQRVHARWVTVVPGRMNDALPYEKQMVNAADCLKAMAEIFEPEGIVMVVEALNPYRNHPWQFLKTIPQAYLLCKTVNSPSCKVLDDLYHQSITEGNLIQHMEMAWEEIPYLQLGDNPGRNEPTTGEINHRSIFKWLKQRGFDGILGMEHGVSQGGVEGERALINAYRWCDATDSAYTTEGATQ